MIIHPDEFTQAVRETFSAHLTEVRYNVPQQTVSILLLVRQQFQLIDQICAQALRYRMRFEDLCLLKTFSCLYNHEPVRLLPMVLLSTNCAPPICISSPRDPPNVVSQGKVVATSRRALTQKKKNKEKVSVKVSTVAPGQNTLRVGAANSY